MTLSNHNEPGSDNEALREFCEFVEAKQAAPLAGFEARVMAMVERDLRPSLRLIFGKLAGVEAAAGVATLFICPQFGIEIGEHNRLLHSIHETFNPFFFFLVCGVIFVIFGAAIGALTLTYNEIQSIKRTKYAYFTLYAFAIYTTFVFAGTEVLIIQSLPWILGAIIGNIAGFNTVSEIRRAFVVAASA